MAVAPAVSETLDASKPVEDVGQRMLVALLVGPCAQLPKCGARGVELVCPAEREGLELASARFDPAGGSDRVQLVAGGLEGERPRERPAKLGSPAQQLDEREIPEGLCLEPRIRHGLREDDG